jgi:hypothetical protein
MTNQQPPTSNNSRESRNLRQKIWQMVKKPRNQIIAVVSLGTIVTAGYIGTRIVITKIAPSRVEAELEKLLKRDVILGKVSTDTLNRINIDGIKIPPTEKDPSYLEIDSVQIYANLWSLLGKRKLWLDIFAEDIEGYAQLDTLRPPSDEKKPLPESFLLPALPITTDISLRLEDTNLLLNRNAKTKAIAIATEGKINFLYDEKKQPLSYQLDNRIGNSRIQVKGKTLFSNTQSESEVDINSLRLAEVASFMPELPVETTAGIVNGKVKINVPKLPQLKESTAKGKITIEDLNGKLDLTKIKQPENSPIIPLLQQDFVANLELKLNNQTVTFDKANLYWGDINANAQGKVDLKKGYDLKANLVSLSLVKILPEVGVKLPVNVTGLVDSTIKVTGKIDDPVIDGNLTVAKSTLDNFDLGTIESQFTANLDEVEIKKVKIKPNFGGEITSQALIKTNLRETVLAGKPFNLNKTNFHLKFLAQLPPNQLLQNFSVDNYGIDFNNLQATGEVKGTLNQPQGLISFAIPKIQGDNFQAVKAEGKVFINKNKVEIVDTQLVADNNSLQINGSSDLKTKNWQINLTGRNFPLNPFITQFCQNNPNCLATDINTDLPIILTRLNSQFQGNLNSLNLENIKGKGDINLQFVQGNLDLDTSLDQGNLLVNGYANSIALNQILTTLPTQVDVINSQIKLTTNIPELLTTDSINNLPPSFSLQASSRLGVETGIVDAVTKIDRQTLNVVADVSQVAFSQIIPNLPLTVTSSQINLKVDTQELYQLANQEINRNQLSSLNLTANVRGKVADGNLTTMATVRNGVLRVHGVTNNLTPALLSSNKNLPADDLNANFTVDGNFNELVDFAFNYLDNKTNSLPPSLKINAQGNLNIAQGKTNFTTKLQNSRWDSQIDSDNINLASLAQGLSLNQQNLGINLASLPKLSSSINLSGSLQNLFAEKITLPIAIKASNLRIGENTVNFQGRLDLVNIFQQPDINNLRLDVASKSQLDTIAVRETLTSLPTSGVNMVPQAINLDGKSEFVGVLTGNNLLTNPFGKNGLNLTGDVALTKFSVDKLAFEESLKGQLIVNPQSKISLDLRGKEDVISFAVVKENLVIPNLNATLPYSPQNLEIRKGGKDGFALLGSRQENNFLASIDNLVLENLQLQPAVNYGVEGKLKGLLSTEIAVNLKDFSIQGNVDLNQPALDFIEAKKISAGFAYQNNLASVTAGIIEFGETEYNFDGKLNLKTQDIQAKVDLEGEMQDIFNTLKFTDLETLTAFAQQVKTKDAFAKAEEIPTQSLGNEQTTIASQVNLLTSIDQQIKAIAQQIRAGKLPNNLDIQGDYQGEILIAGKLQNPTVNLDFTGEQWQWLPQQDFPNVVDSLGLVMEQAESISIPQVSINAVFQNNNLSFQPLLINVDGSEISFVGDISAQSQNGKLQVKNLPLDVATRFAPLPLDVEAIIDLEATIKGRFINPVIEGILILNDTAIDTSIIEEKIVTNFSYKNYELAFNTTTPEYLKIEANLPYSPLFAIEKPAFINLEFDDRSKEIVGMLTENKIVVSDGKYHGKLNIEIDSINQLIKNLDIDAIKVTGNIDFQDTKITSNSFKESVLLTGNIDLSPEQMIKIDKLLATLNKTNITIQGNLPLFTPSPENLLTINVPNQSLKLEGLYSGSLKANLEIDGTALKPEIGGYLTLNNGNFEIPARQTITQTKNQLLWNQWLGDSLNTTVQNLIEPKFNNFVLRLENSQLSQWSLYRFLFAGELNLNGEISNLDNLTAEGAINLRRGQIYVTSANPFTNVVSGLTSSQTIFNLSRTNNNQIIFNPDESLLNPYVDIQVKADIVDYAKELPSTQRNEINDPLIKGGRGENIEVVLDIEGELGQLLPVLSGSISRACTFSVPETIPETRKISTEKLDPVAKCVNLAILNPDLSNVSILTSPLVSLSSTPSRSEGELINLIVGGQLLNLATQLQNLSGEDLIQNGLTQFILVPIANTLSFGINERVSTWGRPLGMKDLRIFPIVEGVYELKEDTNLSISYDYIYEEFKVNYQMRF